VVAFDINRCAVNLIKGSYQDDALLESAICPKSGLGLPSDFVRKGLLLLRSGYVRELAVASYPHIQCGGGDFPCIAGGGCGGWRLA
jgi:hypothetical protein